MRALTKIAFNGVSAFIGPQVAAVAHGDISLNASNPLRTRIEDWGVQVVDGEPMLMLALVPGMQPRGAA